MSHLQHWDYYRFIEKDFVKTTRFVEVDEKNESTFSKEYVRLLLAIGSEVDVVAKLLCETIDARRNRRNIDDYREIILSRHKDFPSTCLFIEKYSRFFNPWETWLENPAENPPWWHSYNNVKHERHKHFDEASLGNVITSLAGLYTVILHLYGSGNWKLAPKKFVVWERGGFGESAMER